MSNIPFSEIQKLEPSAIIELFVLDATSVGGAIYYFHAGTNELNQNLIWKGQTYVRYPIKASGFELTSSGSLPRPKLTVSNFMSGVSALLIQYDDLIGSKIIRKRTLKKYLDAVNFVNGINPSADPSINFPDEVYYIDRKVTEKREFVEFEIVSMLDLSGQMLPKRQIIQNSCSWKYRSSECGYSGTNYFDQYDKSTTDVSKDSCSKKIEACKLRFGFNNTLPFGGFPGAGLIVEK